MSTTFRIVGVTKVLAELENRVKKLDDGVKAALQAEGNAVLKEAMDECPVQTGTLRRSGTVDGPKTSGNNVVVEIGFNTEYAQAVHENLKARHPIGKAKFLEDPVNRAVPGFEGRLASRLGRV